VAETSEFIFFPVSRWLFQPPLSCTTILFVYGKAKREEMRKAKTEMRRIFLLNQE
jgi:hypothetical protein